MDQRLVSSTLALCVGPVNGRALAHALFSLEQFVSITIQSFVHVVERSHIMTRIELVVAVSISGIYRFTLAQRCLGRSPLCGSANCMSSSPHVRG